MSLIRGTIGLAWLVVITLLVASTESRAHEARAGAIATATVRTFGTASLVSHTIHASAFSGAAAADNAATGSDASGDRYCLDTGECRLRAAVMLPAGVDFVEGPARPLALDSSNRGDAVQSRAPLLPPQVSPAPATASFNDVPTTHPFFPCIEALVAAGITTGCGAAPPLYCPDEFVTRKQMAAFLARALGLHWAP